MAGQRNNVGKRPYSQPVYADNGGGKRRNPGDERDGYAPREEDTVYRYLCPGTRIGSIIGKGGEIVKQLRADSHAKIRIGESMQGCEERVVTIFSSDRESGDYVCAAQDALFRVYERLVADEAADKEVDEDAVQATVRLLVPSDQIGCIIGKGGQIIQGIRTDTGAQVRILKSDDLPPCAISGDELLQITGDAIVVRRALHQVSSRLHQNPSSSQHILSSNLSQMYPPAGTYLSLNTDPPVIGVDNLVNSYGGYKGERGADWPPIFSASRGGAPMKEFALRMLFASSCIGGLIGKGGVIIKQIRQDTGAHINIDSSSAEDDCIISISSKECFEDAVSPTIDAALRIQRRCGEIIEKDTGESTFTTRLLVPSARIGCLIGKGGSIITEMRRSTQANIRILSKDDLPKVASEDDEMVQITAGIEIARRALLEITARLRANSFEREGALSSFLPQVPYHAVPLDTLDGSRYGGRDSKSRGYSYSSSYSGPLTDFRSNDGYRSSQVGGGGYGSYGGYTSRSGSTRLSGLNSVSPGKQHGH